MTSFDTIIIGAGVAGSSAAYQLAHNQRVLLLEQYDLLHPYGSSHGDSRIFRHVYDDVRYIDMAVAADEGWQQLERDAGDKLLYRTGGIDVGAAEEMAGIKQALARAGREFEVLEPSDIHRRFPAFYVPDGKETLYQKDGGVLAAHRCVAAMLRVAAKRGVTVRSAEPVVQIEADAEAVKVITEQGAYEAGALIVTAGSWLERLARQLGVQLPLAVEKQQVHYFCAPAESCYDVTEMPTFIDRQHLVYGIPVLERPLMIKAATHHGAPTIDLDTRTFDMNDELARNTVAGVRALLPDVTAEIAHYETCLYTQTPDEHFILDTHPEMPHVVFGGGFSGHGFKFGPTLGRILRDLCVDGASSFDLSLFRIERFGSSDSTSV